MTKRTLPTRVVETGRVVRGPSGQGVGWLQPLEERARNLLAQAQGIMDRLRTPLRNGVPSAIVGYKTFEADTTKQISITDYPVQPDADPFVGLNLTVNPIILAGQTYKIPVLFTPPGVLKADYLSVQIEAGFTMFANMPRQGLTPLADYRQVVPVRGDGTLNAYGGFVPLPVDGAMRFTTQQQILGDFTNVMPFLPFFWNIIDEKSGRQYAQDWMPHGALMHSRGVSARASTNEFEAAFSDSELFEFDTPWLFERDAQVSFLFRPIMDLYQIDASDPTYPYGWNGAVDGVNDLSGGDRRLQATVRVEFHGNRYYEAQDVLKQGAYVTNVRE